VHRARPDGPSPAGRNRNGPGSARRPEPSAL
jgi:hypothetical protein